MTSLHTLIKKIGFKDFYDFKQSRDYQNSLKLAAEHDHNSSPLFVVSLMSSLPICGLVCSFISTNLPLTFGLSFLPTLASLFYAFFAKPKIASIKSAELSTHKTNFCNQLFSFIQHKTGLIELFQALESEPYLKQKIDLAELFHTIKETMAQSGKTPEHIKKEVAHLLEEVFTQFSDHDAQKNSINTQQLEKKSKLIAYQNALIEADSDEFMFSQNPPLSVHGKPKF